MAKSVNKHVIVALAKEHARQWNKKYFYLPFLSSAIAGRNESAMARIMRVALDDGIPARAVDEIILQSHLFLGFPAMIEAARMFAGIKKAGRKRNQLPEAYTSKNVREWHKNGMKKIKKIYGSAFDRLVPYINSFSPQILTWMINDGYGRVLSRPGVSFRLRELSTTATLTVTSYTNQLGAHIRGTLHTGVDKRLIRATIKNCSYFCPPENVTTALDLFTKVTAVK